MKKFVMIVVIAITTGITSADLSIAWRSQAGAVTETDGGNDYLEGSTIQLIWSSSGPTTTPGQYWPLLPGEYILASGVTRTNSLWDGLGGIYTSADVGGNNINTGFFFTRIYETDGSFFEYFLDIPMAAGADYVYNPADPLTVYAQNVVSGIRWIGENGVILIPEPTTAGLFGLGILSSWFIRRNKKSQQ